MAHVYNAANGTEFIHNGDYSGDVGIISTRDIECWVPFEDLKEFLASYVRHQKIVALENADADEILNS